MATNEFDTNPDGTIKTQPVVGYSIAPVAEIAILVRLQYAENEDQLRTGECAAVQLILTPPQALEIAAVLTKHANSILHQSTSGPKS